MRCRRIALQSAASTPCNRSGSRATSPWLTTSADLSPSPPTTTTTTTAVAATVKCPLSEVANNTTAHLYAGWWSCSMAAYSWLLASVLHSTPASVSRSSLLTACVHTAQHAARLPEAQVPSRSCALRRRGAVSLAAGLLCASQPYRALHTTSARPFPSARTTTRETTTAAAATSAEDGAFAYNQDQHVENAEGVLREMYGPQAKLVVHRLQQRRQRTKPHDRAVHEDASQDTSNSTPAPSHAASRPEEASDAGAAAAVAPDFYYRASATFRLLGFPVELAVAKGRHPKDAIEACLQQSLASDITFIRPAGNHQNYTRHQHHHNSSKGGGATSYQRRDSSEDRGETGGVTSHNQRNRNHGKNNNRRHSNQTSNNNSKNQKGQHSNSRAQSVTSFGQMSDNAMHAQRSPRLTPHQMELKAIMDDLRRLCIQFSRTVKFSIKPPSLHPSNPASAHDAAAREAEEEDVEERDESGRTNDRQWRCRCYVKEEWSTNAHARLALEVAGSSPNDVLVQCVSQLRQRYREEADSASVMEEGVREVAGLVQLQGKTVTATSAAEPSSLAAAATRETAFNGATGGELSGGGALMEVPTYRAHVDVTDAHGNTSVYTARRQASRYLAYESAAALAQRGEVVWDAETHLLSEGMATPPLLWRLRWQFDLLLDHICRETGQTPAEVAWVQVTGSDPASSATEGHSSMHTDATSVPDNKKHAAANEGGAGPNEMKTVGVEKDTSMSGDPVMGALSYAKVPLVPTEFTGCLYAERDVLVWQTSGGGRYRVEFDTYVQALYHLLDQYGDCLSTLPCMAPGVGEGLLCPCASVLDLYVHRHDAFPILQHHHGNINCYALLGTLTQQLLGCPYETHYHHDPATKEYVCTLTVNDGRSTCQPLIQRRSKQKGESWRFACLDAMRENFPRQYAAILDRHPEVDLSSSDVSSNAHLRSLPREKRVPFFASLSVMVLVLAEEDLGWRQARVRLRNLANSLGLPQWTAELEAQVEGEEARRVVAVSASFTQMQTARRSLIYRLAKQYFPDELAVYAKLRRSDAEDPESDDAARANKFYIPNAVTNASMLNHVVALMEGRHPSSAPVRVTLEARVKNTTAASSTRSGLELPPGLDEAEAADEASLRELLDLRYVDGDTSLLQAQNPITALRPPRLHYTARVLGNRGDVLIADFDSDSATTTADAQAVPVLVTALKSASFHLAGGDAETLWTEYETYPLPSTLSPRGLSIELFNRFFGNAVVRDVAVSAEVKASGGCGSGSSDGSSNASLNALRGSVRDGAVAVPGAVVDTTAEKVVTDAVDGGITDFGASVTVVTTQLGAFWFGTAVLPAFGMLPLGRAVASTKGRCINDALLGAARRSFPRVLQYAIQHDVAIAATAAAVLTQPIVEQLPPAECRDIVAQLSRKKATGPLPPFQLLVKCTKETYPMRERFIRVQQTYDNTHGFQYRLYLQRGRAVRPGDTQLVGYGASATSAPAALHRAAVMALENLYETTLYSAVAAQPNYRDPPPERDALK